MSSHQAMNDDQTPHSHPRTEAALQRLRQAMATIEAEIEAHGGRYPYNHGRMNQSELCRRADVKKATLQNPVHRDTTRVEIIQWCDAVNARLMQAKDAARLEDGAAPQADASTAQALQQQLDAALRRISELEQENATLRERLGLA
jgi:glutathione S-transferase